MFKRLFFVFLLLTFIPRHSFAQTTIALTPPGSVVAVCEGNTVSLTATSNDPNALFAIAIVSINGQAYVNSGTASATTVDGANRTFTFNSQSFTIGDATTTFEYRVRFGSTFNIAQFGLGGSFQTTNSETITVNPLPTATLTALGGINSVCQNASSPTVNITGVIGTAPFTFTYRITDPLGNIGSNQTIVSDVSGLAQLTVPTNGTTGVYTYELLQIQDGSSTTCSNASTATLTMTISPLPTATISANTLTSCVNSTAPVVTITGLGGTAPYTFTYREITNGTPGSNQTIISNLAGVATFSATVSSAATRNYELVSVQESSATACVNAQTSSVTIVTNINPNATGVDPGLPAICYGTSNFNVTFSGVTGGPDQYRIVWDGTALGAGFTNDGFQAYNTGTNTITVNVPGTVTAGTTYNGTLRLLNSSTGCFLENSSSVTINPLPTAVITASTLSVCLNESTLPTITITATGATAPYTVTYNVTTNGVTVSNLTTLTNLSGVATLSVPTGTAAIIVYQLVSVESSVTNCVNAQNASVTVTVNDLPAATITPFSATTFCAGGSVTLNANTGASLSYLWSDASTGSSISNITNSGTYSVTVTNTSTGCFATSTVTTVTVNALPAATITPSGATTFCAGGSVTLNANTGGSLSYLWSDASTGSSISNITNSGTYSVTVTNTSTGCFTTSTVTTVTVNALPAATITPSGATTFCAGGSITLNANTGGSLNYLWSDASTGSSISNITNSGTYSVTVTNTSTGCFATSTVTTVTVNALPAATITPSGATTFCAGGSVTLNANTGGSLNYLWSDASTGSSISNITNSGTYSVTVTNTSTGCFATSTVTTVTVNALPAATITPSGATTFCAGGSVTLNANTGGSLNYLWSDASTGSSISNITNSGTYSVTVTNTSTGCFATSTVTTVTVNALPAATITPSGATTFCAGVSVTLNANIGGSLSYLWSDASTASSITNITNSGTYSVTVTNTSTGCFATSTVTTVTVNALPAATITPSGATTFCAGVSVTLNANTGGSLNYLWSDASTGSSISNITNSGTFSVTVTNTSTGCFATSTVTTVTVNALPAATITPSGATTFCAGGSVTLNANTGGSLSYLWSDASTGSSISNITNSGTYSVTVTNTGTGCFATSTVTTITVNALPVATITASGPLTFCAGGSVNLTASAGNSYLWSNASNGSSISNISTSGTYTVTITDGNGCQNTSSPTVITVNALPTPGITASGPLTFCAGNSVNLTGTGGTSYLWSNGTNAALTNITTSGTYSVTVTDGNGCQNITSTTVTVNPLPTATINANGPLTFCAGGSVSLTASAGNSYLWSNGSNSSSVSNISTSGTYTVTVTDGNGCQNTSSPTVITVNALPTAGITTSGHLTFCAGNSVNLTGTGGTTYLWSNGTNAALTNITSSGTYSVTVTDGNGCQNSTSTTVTVNPLPTATINANGPLTFCAGGTVNLTASAGNSYLWSNASTASSINNITTSGTYTVTVTDGNGCQNTSSPTTITVNALPSASINASGALTFCAGGSVNLTASAGASYLWSNASTGSSISNISTSGTYTVTVTDGNGCQNTSSPAIITVNPLPTASITTNGPLTFCAGGSVNLSANAASSYLWSNGSTGSSISNITSSGTYTVTVTDGNGCQNTSSPTTITVNALPVATITPTGPITFCTGGSVNLNANTGAGLNYLWSNGSTGSSISNITTSGTYTVTVTNQNNCSATSAPVTITVNAIPNLTVTNPAAVCAPGTVDLTAADITVGSTAGLSYTYWTNAAATQSLNTPFAIGTAGTYYIKGTNTTTNCASIRPVIVSINPQAAMQINTPAPVCAPGTVDLTATAITNGSAAGLSYTYFTNAAATNVLANPNAVSSSGVYYIKGTPATGCSAIVPVTVTINGLPTLTVNNPAAVCSPQVINLMDASITAGSSSGLNFAYFSNASLTTPVTNAQNVNNSGIFYIRATDAITGCFRVAPVTVQINAAPQGTLQIPSGNIICENSSLTLNASGANRYQWLLNQQPINGATAANLNATEAGIYAVKFISAQGCETVSSNTINLELLRKPTVQFTVSNACAGVTANFSNTSITSASGGINWLWDFGDGVTSNLFSPGHIYTTPGNYIVRLTATSPICTGFNEASLKTYTVQSAAPGIRYKDVEVLKDIPVAVQARNIGNSYVWSPSTGVNNINTASPSIRVNITTDYTVAITNDIGCTTIDSVLIKVIPGVDIYVPKGFSPNNDGQNDRLYPILVGMRQLNYFRVFNRWGNMIFTTKDSAPQSGWNGLYLGVMQPTGTYTWIAEAVDVQGNIVRKTGTVLLLQ